MVLVKGGRRGSTLFDANRRRDNSLCSQKDAKRLATFFNTVTTAVAVVGMPNDRCAKIFTMYNVLESIEKYRHGDTHYEVKTPGRRPIKTTHGPRPWVGIVPSSRNCSKATSAVAGSSNANINACGNPSVWLVASVLENLSAHKNDQDGCENLRGRINTGEASTEDNPAFYSRGWYIRR